MLPAKILISPRTLPLSSPPPKLRSTRYSSFRSCPYLLCLPREEEASSASTAGDPSPRISPKASPQLARWSRTRALRSGRRLERPNIRSKTSCPPSSSYLLGEILSETEDVEEESASPPPADGKPIYMVSDGTGWTAEHSVNAALGQFEYCLVDRGCPVNTHLFSGITIDLESMHSVHFLNPFFATMLHTNPNSAKVSHSNRHLITSPELGVLLQSCINFRSLKQGRELHIRIRESGLEWNPILLPKLLKLYSVCGQIGDARELFDRIPQRNLDTFAYTAMITGYVRNEAAEQAIKLFCEILERGLEPDSYTFSALLKASTNLSLHQLSTNLHSLILKCGSGSSLSVGNSLIHAYGSVEDAYSAHKVFGKMPVRDIVSWSSMIGASSSAKYFTQSATLFSKMQFEEFIRPNEITIVSLLPACSFFSSLRKGQSIHAYVIRSGFDSNIIVNSALITMYSRCGNPDAAFMLFNNMEEKNVFVWTTMIEGFSINGNFELALKLFKEMQEVGLKPNSFTLIVVLSACSHGGLIEEGLMIFDTMKVRFHIDPGTAHYACVVDMLSRGGKLNEAENFIEKMELPLTGSILGSLLGACQVHRNVKLGEKLAVKLFQLEPYNETNYVVLSNIYASVGRWDDVGRVRRLMAVKGLSKSSGCSWVEIKEKVYVFGAHDQSHSESESIYQKIAELNYMIVKEGYVPSTQFVLHDVDDDDKKRLLNSHSERLAIAFGLLKAPPNVPIRIMKNLRVCVDCHDAIKLISKVVSREFIIRDTRRFHHFSQGSCSCGDYW